MTIISHADICDGVPRIDGFDVTVIDIYDAHARHGMEPAEVADEYEVPLARVHEALAFYLDHVEWMRSLERGDDEPDSDGFETPPMGEYLSENQDADDL